MTLFGDKTRWQHFGWAIPAGLLLTILFVAGLATGMEFKDYKYVNKWDWADWACTMLGGLVGQALQILLIYIIF